MKRRSYAELDWDYQKASEDATINQIMLNAVVNNEPYAQERRGNYRARVYRPTAAHGGIVILTYRCSGQADYTSAYYLDAWAANRQIYPDSSNKEGCDLNALQHWAVEYRNKAVHAENAAAIRLEGSHETERDATTH